MMRFIVICAIIFFKVVENSMSAPSRPTERRKVDASNDRIEKHSQIIHFNPQGNSSGGKKRLSFFKASPRDFSQSSFNECC